MPINHIEKRVESPEVDRFQDRHFECGKLYLFSACHTDVSFKLPLEKSIKYVQVLKETIDLN